MCIDPRPHAGPELAQLLPPTEGRHRERHVDTMLCFTKTDRLFVQYLAEYSARGCSYSVLRVTNQLAHKMHVAHRTDSLVEPRGNTLPQGSWKYKATADCAGLCSGFY